MTSAKLRSVASNGPSRPPRLIGSVVVACAAFLSALPHALGQEERYIVRFKERTTAAATIAALTEYDLRSDLAIGLSTIAILQEDRAVVTVLSSSNAEQLAQRPDIESVERDTPLRASRTTNDPYLPRLYGLQAFPGIAATTAWNTTIGSTKALVAVIDSGIDFTHPDLQGAVWHNPGEIQDNGRDDDRNGLVDDYYGYDFLNRDGVPVDDYEHGTHVSGTIAARGNNRRGVVGVAWGTQVVPLKVLDQNGSAYSSDIVQAIDYAGTLRKQGNPIVAINMSLAGPHSAALERAIRRAMYNNLLIVAGAGNDFRNIDEGDEPVFPARYRLPNVIAVSAVDRFGNLSSYSNFGERTVSLAAPGDSIFSTLPKYSSGVSYGYMSGTSMAAPHVTGVAALVAAVNPKLTAPLIKQVLLKTGRLDPALEGLTRTKSIVDAAAAVAHAPFEPFAFRLTGRVTKDGVGISGVTVTAQAVGKRIRRTQTNANGYYRLSRLEAASYSIRATKKGEQIIPRSSGLILYRNRSKDFRVTVPVSSGG
jgi:subtilisin family serine protease